MLSLEATLDFTATGWGIQVHERNELDRLNREHVKNQKTHITETHEIKYHPKDVILYQQGELQGTMLDFYLQFMLQLEKYVIKKHYYISHN